MFAQCFPNALIRTVASRRFGGRVDGESGCVDFAGLAGDEEGEGGIRGGGWRRGKGAQKVDPF